MEVELRINEIDDRNTDDSDTNDGSSGDGTGNMPGRANESGSL